MESNAKHLQKIIISFVTIWLIGLVASPVSYAGDKIKARLNLDYYNENGTNIYLDVRVRYKENRKYFPAEGVELYVFLNEEMDEGLVGKVMTNAEGIGRIALTEILKTLADSVTSFELIATLSDNPNYRDARKSTTIYRAALEVEVDQTDSLTQLTFNFSKYIGASESEGLAEEDVKVYVNRFLGSLPIGEEYASTDDDGNLTVTLPTDLPEDVNGKLIIIGKVEDHDEYGNLSIEQVIDWNVARNTNDTFGERTLWASRDKTPLWLLIFPNIIIVSVWGTLLYLVFLLFKIRSIGKQI